MQSANTQQLETGSRVHRTHVRTVRRWAVIQRLGLGVIMAGLILIVLQLANTYL